MVVLEPRVHALEVEVGKMAWDWKDYSRAQSQKFADVQLTQTAHTTALTAMRATLNEHGLILRELRLGMGDLVRAVKSLMPEPGPVPS